MTEKYLVPSDYGEAELEEKKSRFLSKVWRCQSETEALAHLGETRTKYWDASHNVYAYIIKEGGVMRFSDDGEPGGTAGMPTLNALRMAGVTDICCVVTRYFGGTKLGSGGLVRMYSTAASAALKSAGISEMRIWIRLKTTVPYSLFERIKRETENRGVLENADYGAEIELTLLLPETETKGFSEALRELSAGSATVEIVGREFLPAPYTE